MSTFTLQDGSKMYYKIFGPELKQSDIKTMIFNHGGPGLVDGRIYYEFWKQFASNNLRIIFPEQRGSGRSEDPRNSETLNISQHAKDLNDFCTGLEIINPIIAGVSQGGYVGISFAEQFPNKLRALILCNSEAKREPEERIKAFRKNLPLFFDQTEEYAKFIANKIQEYDAHWNWEEYAKLFANFYSKKGETFTGVFHELTFEKFMGHEFDTFDLRPDLTKIICPILYLVGQYDCIHPAASAIKTRDAMVNAKIDFHVVEDSADPVYIDQWEIATKLVTDFLAAN